mgnify:CR=1 FL=1
MLANVQEKPCNVGETEWLYIKIVKKRRSLKLQGLRTHLPIQDTWVRSLIWDDPICPAAAKPLNHNH